MKKTKYIGKMIGFEIGLTILMALIGVGLCMWFGSEAKPTIRTIRDASEWTNRFAMFFYIGCGFTLIYSLLMTLLAAVKGLNKTSNWIANLLVIALVAIALAVVFFLTTPSKTVACWITGAVAILLQGPVVFIVSSLFQPGDWVYCPFVR